ncbi:MAG TPA: inositol monophosphatase family protein [Blastocatellia bacterium]|nr:inositol monophosphatase family protein [Blastocatellia bacterium]
MTQMRELAIQVAREAGALLRDYAGRTIAVSQKSSAIDLVTEVDLLSERLIVERISTHYPKHQILAEESGQTAVASDYRWLIDPLDGTTNYAHGYPFYCVAIALEYKGEIILGVVYDPNRDELFVAERGAGATCNGRPIRVSRTARLTESLLATGFPYDVRRRPTTSLDYFGRFVLTAQAIRRDGSAALDLCYLACGRFDGFWEQGLAPWDMAAGFLIVEEAGGRVTTFDGGPFTIYKPEMLATNGLIHQEMMEVLCR